MERLKNIFRYQTKVGEILKRNYFACPCKHGRVVFKHVKFWNLWILTRRWKHFSLKKYKLSKDETEKNEWMAVWKSDKHNLFLQRRTVLRRKCVNEQTLVYVMQKIFVLWYIISLFVQNFSAMVGHFCSCKVMSSYLQLYFAPFQG